MIKRMELDIDALAADEAAGWDYSVMSGGRSFPTRPLGIDDYMAMRSISRDIDNVQGNPEAAFEVVGKIRAFVLGLFPGEKPDVASWSFRVINAVFAGIVTYSKSRQRAVREAGEKP